MALVNESDAPVLLFEHAAGGRVVAEARLNVESTLNSLSLAMIDILAPALTRWQRDDAVVAVLITGAGERAFCAGGDIQALYHAMVANHAAGELVNDYPFRFFEREYRLDHQLHTYPKPLVCLAHGICMGGGLGIFSAARYRVVTETSRVALPEVTIGLFPDAGGTWLLAHLPRHIATFMALTGAHMNAADVRDAGLASHGVAADQRHLVLERLLASDWSTAPADHHACVERALADLPAPQWPAAPSADVPQALHPDGGIAEVAARVRELAGRSAWIDKGIATMERGCPASVGVVVRQLQRAPGLSLADTFRLEMTVASQCARHPDFAEGVRALLIDKDNRPRWRYPDLDALPDAYVEEHFESPWPQNPLNDLEEETA